MSTPLRTVLATYQAHEHLTEARQLVAFAHAYERAYIACLSFVGLLMCDIGRMNGQTGAANTHDLYQRTGRGLCCPINAHVHRACIYALQLAEHARRGATTLVDLIDTDIAQRISDRMKLSNASERVPGTSLTGDYAYNAMRIYERALVFYRPFMDRLCFYTTVDTSILAYHLIVPLANSSICMRNFDYNKSSAGASIHAMKHAFDPIQTIIPEEYEQWKRLVEPLLEFTKEFSQLCISQPNFLLITRIFPLEPTPSHRAH